MYYFLNGSYWSSSCVQGISIVYCCLPKIPSSLVALKSNLWVEEKVPGEGGGWSSDPQAHVKPDVITHGSGNVVLSWWVGRWRPKDPCGLLSQLAWRTPHWTAGGPCPQWGRRQGRMGIWGCSLAQLHAMAYVCLPSHTWTCIHASVRMHTHTEQLSISHNFWFGHMILFISVMDWMITLNWWLKWQTKGGLSYIRTPNWQLAWLLWFSTWLLHPRGSSSSGIFLEASPKHNSLDFLTA